MARKNILQGLMEPPAPDAAAMPERAPRPARGAIGAVSRSIADLKTRAVAEIDPFLIDAGGLSDRLESDAEADQALTASIAEYGQQVPVLVRPHPEVEGRYQIVYGRRRVLALRDLGQPVKVLVRELDDHALIMAQGQENSARRDLSFIEKVNFARQMEQQGYDRKVIGDALSIDKTLVSRMLSVAERVPADVIAMIGAAPSVGRDRWLALADLLAEAEIEVEELSAMIGITAASERSDDRFQAAWAYLQRLHRMAQPPATATSEARRLYAASGLPLGQARYDRNFCTLKLRRASAEGFDAWLLDELPTLFAAWQKQQPPQED